MSTFGSYRVYSQIRKTEVKLAANWLTVDKLARNMKTATDTKIVHKFKNWNDTFVPIQLNWNLQRLLISRRPTKNDRLFRKIISKYVKIELRNFELPLYNAIVQKFGNWNGTVVTIQLTCNLQQSLIARRPTTNRGICLERSFLIRWGSQYKILNYNQFSARVHRYGHWNDAIAAIKLSLCFRQFLNLYSR